MKEGSGRETEEGLVLKGGEEGVYTFFLKSVLRSVPLEVSMPMLDK